MTRQYCMLFPLLFMNAIEISYVRTTWIFHLVCSIIELSMAKKGILFCIDCKSMCACLLKCVYTYLPWKLWYNYVWSLFVNNCIFDLWFLFLTWKKRGKIDKWLFNIGGAGIAMTNHLMFPFVIKLLSFRKEAINNQTISMFIKMCTPWSTLLALKHKYIHIVTKNNCQKFQMILCSMNHISFMWKLCYKTTLYFA